MDRESRQNYLGGSDAHHLLTAEPYGCLRRLWYDKLGVPADYPPAETAAMIRGKRVEDIIAGAVVEVTGWKLRRRQEVGEGRLRAHLDRHIVGRNGRGPGVLEIKSANEWHFRKVITEGPPFHWLCQVQWYLALTRWQWGAIAVMDVTNWALEIVELERDDALCDGLLNAAARFWEMVESGAEPDRLKADDPRCATCPWRTQCQGERLLGDYAAAADVQYRDDLAPLTAEYLEIRRLRDEIEERMEALRKQLLEETRDARAVDTVGARVLHLVYEQSRWDSKRLVADLRAARAALNQGFDEQVYKARSVVEQLRVLPR